MRNKPVAVVGDAKARHGIVLAKNNIAKMAGIKTGQVIWEAKKICPTLITVGARFGLYLKYSQLVRRIYEDYTDRIEPFGIDECWLDVTGSRRLFGDGEQIAETIRQRIKSIGLTVSIGVSWNKIYAKLGSDLKKPDAITVIDKSNYKEVVWPLPVENLLYVGSATRRKLKNVNIKTIGGLAEASERLLVSKLGKWGSYLHAFANGLDNTPVALYQDVPTAKSVGNSLTNYRDLVNEEEVKTLVYLLAESVVSRCREMGIYKVKTVSILIRDSKLSGFVRQGKLPLPSLVTNDIVNFAMQLFRINYTWTAPVRAVGVSVSDFLSQNNEQLDLLRDEQKYAKIVRLENTVEKIKKEFGPYSIQRARILTDKKFANMDVKSEHVIHPENFFKDKN